VASRVVNVDIHGQRYAVRSDLDPQYIAELARFLDEKMGAAARELASSDPLRIAVIAALNITDELYRARVDSEGADGRVRARTEAIERLLDAVLEEARIHAVN
jgi:cell division protein ZapA